VADQTPQTVQIARFALAEHTLPDGTAEQLKRHLLDSLGSLIFSLHQETPAKLRRQIQLIGEGGACAVPGLGWVAFDRAAQWLTALIRYPDFMDNFLGKEATCHPSDNIGGLLAAGLLQGGGGRDFLTAMAVAYQIECRLIEVVSGDEERLRPYGAAGAVADRRDGPPARADRR
jgi:2-methylcitrate dehydratase